MQWDVIVMRVKKCDFCPHSMAAHTDGIHCSLCRCRSERRDFVQETLTFRSNLITGRPPLKKG